MTTKTTFKLLLVLSILFIFTNTSISQVGINTSSPVDGALLDISSSDKGFLMTRVALTGTNDVTTITPAATTGLIVYNTATAGLFATQVTPGFYYWSGTQWRRLFTQGYTLKYDQTAQVATAAGGVDLPGLNTGYITVPFSGTYQILVNAYYAVGDRISGTTDGAAQGSIGLVMRTGVGSFVTLKEAYVTSSSKLISGANVNNLAQNVTILYNVDLVAGTTYTFKVQGWEWLTNNANPGHFGRNTSGYSGSTTNDAQRGTMTITLIKQN